MMAPSRIEVPIPQQEPEEETNRPPEFKFIERVDGLVECHAKTLQDHIAAFRAVTSEMDDHYWAQAAVAASASKKYGKAEDGDKMQELSEAVELSVSYLRQIARTYRTFTTNFSREKSLYFSYHRIACDYKNPEKALAVARGNGMSCRALEEWISDQRKKEAKKKTRKAQKAAQTDFLLHLEHVESVIDEDFIKNCPSKDFARRVYEKGWLQEIKFELRQFNRKLNEELIRAAIDDDGARTLQEIKEVTTLAMSDVESLVGQFVALNEYEWVREGGETDMARGGRRMILHKVGTACGN